MPIDLWNFTLSYYAKPGVEALCLGLQEQGEDVCLLLCCLWLEQRKVPADAERLMQLRELAQQWQTNVVHPLRRLRQEWRCASQQDHALHQLREQLKALELAAEQELLQRLEQASQMWQAADKAAAWLELLLGSSTARQQLRAAL